VSRTTPVGGDSLVLRGPPGECQFVAEPERVLGRIRVRDGVASTIALNVDPPFGSPSTTHYTVQPLELEPGDRLMFLTDGMLERTANTVDVHPVLTACQDLHPREAVQHMTRTIVEACGGELSDDATVLCFDRHGGPPRDRDANAGADR